MKKFSLKSNYSYIIMSTLLDNKLEKFVNKQNPRPIENGIFIFIVMTVFITFLYLVFYYLWFQWKSYEYMYSCFILEKYCNIEDTILALMIIISPIFIVLILKTS